MLTWLVGWLVGWCQIATYTWANVPAQGAPPSPRYSHTATLVNGNVFVFGGFDGRQALNDLYIFNIGMAFHQFALI